MNSTMQNSKSEGLLIKWRQNHYFAAPEAATVAVLLLDEGELKVAGVYGEGDTLSSAVMGGFSIALADIFRG